MGKLLCAMESTDEASDADPSESQGAADHQGGAAKESGGPAAGGGHTRLVPIRAGLFSFPLDHACPHLSLTGSRHGSSGESSHQGHPAAPLLSPVTQARILRPVSATACHLVF